MILFTKRIRRVIDNISVTNNKYNMNTTKFITNEMKINKQMYELGLIDHVTYLVTKYKLKAMRIELNK